MSKYKGKFNKNGNKKNSLQFQRQTYSEPNSNSNSNSNLNSNSNSNYNHVKNAEPVQVLRPEDKNNVLQCLNKLYNANFEVEFPLSPPLLLLSILNTDFGVTPILHKIVDTYLEEQSHVWSKNPRLANGTGSQQKLSYANTIRDVFTRSAVLFSLDVEAWEMNTKLITEIGIAIYDPFAKGEARNNIRDANIVNLGGVSIMPTIKQIHIRIKETVKLINGQYVPNHVDNFNGGTTLVLSRYEAAVFVQALIDHFFVYTTASENGDALVEENVQQQLKKTYLVGHDVGGDVKWLKNLGISLPQNHLRLDTAQMMKIQHGKDNVGLARSLQLLDIPHNFLHNAGNDAYYTLLLAFKLCDPYIRLLKRLDVALVEELSPEEIEDKKKAAKERREAKESRRQLHKEQVEKVANEIQNMTEEEKAQYAKLKKQEEEKLARERKMEKKFKLIEKRKELQRKIRTCNDATLMEIQSAIEATSFLFGAENNQNQVTESIFVDSDLMEPE